MKDAKAFLDLLDREFPITDGLHNHSLTVDKNNPQWLGVNIWLKHAESGAFLCKLFLLSDIDRQKPAEHIIAEIKAWPEILPGCQLPCCTVCSCAGNCTEKLVETTKTRTCNRHVDCDAADTQAVRKGRSRADHCHDEDCEDCLGC